LFLVIQLWKKSNMIFFKKSLCLGLVLKNFRMKFYFVWSLIIIGIILFYYYYYFLILVVKLWKKSNMKKKNQS
jgi:chromate transport protein ChrA